MEILIVIMVILSMAIVFCFIYCVVTPLIFPKNNLVNRKEEQNDKI